MRLRLSFLLQHKLLWGSPEVPLVPPRWLLLTRGYCAYHSLGALAGNWFYDAESGEYVKGDL